MVRFYPFYPLSHPERFLDFQAFQSAININDSDPNAIHGSGEVASAICPSGNKMDPETSVTQTQSASSDLSVKGEVNMGGKKIE